MKIIFILFLIPLLNGSYSEALDPWNLPAFPKVPPSNHLDNVSTTDKLIPRHLWIAVKDLKDGLSYQMPPLFERNKNWKVHICSNEMKDEFMNKTFAGTSLLWAYNSISPIAGAAKVFA